MVVLGGRGDAYSVMCCKLLCPLCLLVAYLCFFQVAELFSRFGAVDVKPFTRFRALVAVGDHGRCVKTIFLVDKKHD
jgi:hypothetical protein